MFSTRRLSIRSSYVVVHGSHQSGSLESLRAADGNHLVVSSTTSGVERKTYVEFTISGVVGPVRRLDFKAILKSSASSTTARIYAYDVTARAWTQLNASLVGTTGVTRNISVSTKARRYVDAVGTVRVRIQSAERFPAYALSVELLRVTIPLGERGRGDRELDEGSLRRRLAGQRRRLGREHFDPERELPRFARPERPDSYDPPRHDRVAFIVDLDEDRVLPIRAVAGMTDLAINAQRADGGPSQPRVADGSEAEVPLAGRTCRRGSKYDLTTVGTG
jgi:hypothetical protein